MPAHTTTRVKTSIEELQDLVAFGASKLSGHVFPFDKHRTRKGLVFQYMGVTQGLVEPIADLCNDRKTTAATMLVRSLFEVYVTVIYLFCGPGHQNVVRGMRKTYLEKVKSTKKWDTFLEGNPHLRKGFDIAALMKVVPKWEKYQKRTEKIFLKRYNHSSYSWPNFADMVKEIDDWNNVHHFSKTHHNNLTWTHLTVYSYWSRFVHMDFEALNALMKPVSGGFELMINGDPDDAEKLCISAYGFYFKILDIFSNQFGTPSRAELRPYRDTLKAFARAAGT